MALYMALPVAQAQTPVQTAAAAKSVHQYDIPAGSLSTALGEWGAQSDRQVVFVPGLVEGKHSRGVSNRYSVEQALTRLLVGTGLTWRRVNSQTYALKKAPPPADNQTTSGQSAINIKHQKTKHQKKVEKLEGVKVTGIIQSQMHAIQLKRTAPDIQDSITSVNIGQLPDITIANSLARITGVQIDRFAGEGTTINVRGLPEVTTLLNGEAFLTADNIYSIQPNYEGLPSSLFQGADVIKSPTANLTTSGISGTINLRTRQPWNLPFGWTVAGAAEAGRGQASKSTKPNANVLFGYNAHGKWGFLIGASYSDLVHSADQQGTQNSGATLMAGENSSSANLPSKGFLTSWAGSPTPPQVRRLADGGVDVNGDGKSDGAFFSPIRFEATDGYVQPKRQGVNAAFQYAFGGGLTLTADTFYTHEVNRDDTMGVITQPVDKPSPVALPLIARDTGVVLHNPHNNPGIQKEDWNQNYYTVQRYNVFIGDLEPFSIASTTRSTARNNDIELKFDNGGAFSGNLRFINATASEVNNTFEMDLSGGNGEMWPNVLEPGVSLPNTTYVGPANQGGNYVYNTNGVPQYTTRAIVDWQGENPVWSFMPETAATRYGMESTYRVKSPYSEGSNAHAGMTIVRFDGNYSFNNDFSLDFGLRNSIRSANFESYVWASRKYAGNGASDPDGCLVRWTTSDTVLSGQGVLGACTAGNGFGDFRGNDIIGPINQLPSAISSNMVKLVNPADTTGLATWALNSRAIKNPENYYRTLEGNTVVVPNPGSTWNVLLHAKTGYAQANFAGTISGKPFSGNFGVRVVRTDLSVTQSLIGPSRPYGVPQTIAGRRYTRRSYTDILPAINVGIMLTPKLKVRLAASKNMMPLSLNEWGGGLSRGFSFLTLPSSKTVEAVESASSGGNPDLNPWRSTNFGASVEYYINKNSMISLAAFRMRIASFLTSSTRTVCNIPDQDGVVRRCVPLSEPVQGTGATLHGFEFDYRQRLRFLPGFLSHTGFDVNATYSPSNSGSTDLAGRSVPFPDNSKKVGNVTFWYQNHRLQIHLSGNYRSKRAVAENHAGVTGFELYQAPTVYLDGDISYKIAPGLQLYFQGENLTNERQKYYLVWKDEKDYSMLSERYYMLGVRFHF